jgi:hypothetical protein
MNTLDLLAELKRLNVKLSLAGDKLRLEAPTGILAKELQGSLQQYKAELKSLLSGQPVEVLFWPGVKSNVYRARQTCLEAEGCLQLTREVDCRLFPLTWCWGWCRERVSANDQAVN